MKRKAILLLLSAILMAYLVALAGSSAARQAGVDQFFYIPSVASKYKDNPKIVFRSDRDGNRELYVVNADGTGLFRLTNHPGIDQDQNWSPDGMSIVYASQRNGNYDLYSVNYDGSNLSRLTNTPADEIRPVWSPNGSQIAYTVGGAIYRMNADGSGQTLLAAAGGGLDWSPDGSQIAYTAAGVVYVMNADGSGPTPITNVADAYAYELDWAPFGNQITFRGEIGSNQEIFVVNADGSGLSNLTNGPGVDLDPTWSPDGQNIAYSCNFDICVMDASGANQVTLAADPASDSNPSWSYDGKQISFVSDRAGNSDIYIVKTDDTGLIPLTTHPASDWRPKSQP